MVYFLSIFSYCSESRQFLIVYFVIGTLPTLPSMPNKKKNGFFYFMQALPQEMTSRGEGVPFPQMQAIASPRWKSMTPEEKDRQGNVIWLLRNNKAK